MNASLDFSSLQKKPISGSIALNKVTTPNLQSKYNDARLERNQNLVSHYWTGMHRKDRQLEITKISISGVQLASRECRPWNYRALFLMR